MKRVRFAMGTIFVSVAAVLPAATPAAGQAPSNPLPMALTAADRNGGYVAERVEHFPTYAGIQVTPDHAAIEVFVTRPEAALHSAAVSASGGATVRLTTVRYTYGALSALHHRIARDSAALRAAGIDVVYIAVRDELNKVGVGVVDYTAEKAAWLQSRYPRDMVVAIPEERPRSWASRESDSAPWWGGSFILTNSGGGCTTGPTLRNAANERFMLTAGHCYVSPGTKVTTYTKATWQQSPIHSSGPLLGWARAELPAYGATGYDVALIDVNETGSAGGFNFRTDPPAQQQSVGAPQKRTIRAIRGTPACMSGAYSGERCAADVEVFDGSYYPYGLSGPKIHHANRLDRRVSTEPVGGPGDSGGSVYQVQSDGLAIAGHILGGQSSGLTCTNNSYYNRGTQCDDQGWFAGIGSIQAYLGMTVVVN